MPCRDRTDDFFALLDECRKLHTAVDPNASAGLATQRTVHHTPANGFTKQATKAKDSLRTIDRNLDKLRHLIKKNSVFDDPTVEIESISSEVQHDISALQRSIEHLQREGGCSAHSQGVITALRTQMVTATQDLGSILQTRQQRVVAQAAHREHFSSVGTLSANDITREAAAPLFGQHAPMFEQAQEAPGGLRKRAGGSTMLGSGSGVFANGSLDEDEESGAECVLTMPSATEMHDQMQLRRRGDQSRLAAAEGVERMIKELGSTFQQMAGLVSQQGELVQSIDNNVDGAMADVEQGESNLTKYFDNISSDRAMVLKVLGAMLVFGLLFLVILR